MGALTRPVGERSRPLDVLLAVDREAPLTLVDQVGESLRRAIRAGELRAGTRLPSTRALALQLGVSRRIAVEAYAALGAEGLLVLRPGASPTVAEDLVVPPTVGRAAAHGIEPLPRHDLRPARPDVSAFPRGAWARSLRHAVSVVPDEELVYGDPSGVAELRGALADHLGRARGVVASPDDLVVVNGYLQGLGLVCRALAERGARRIALEDPSAPEQGPIARRAGLEPVPVPVDDQGLRVDALAAADVQAVVLTPAHQHPTGVVLAPERRLALRRWLEAADAYAVEDDYDAEYRYDRAAVGALQGLAPARVVYAGSASKILAPALRLGWLVVPTALRAAVVEEKLLADQGTARIEQHAFADFMARGELDRHLRRMRSRYRDRRDALLHALAEQMPDAEVCGIAAGLHVTLRLPAPCDERRLVAEAGGRRVALSTLSDYRPGAFAADPVLLLGYARLPEAAAGTAVRALVEAVRAAT